MKSYKYELINNHLVFDTEEHKRILFDTGSLYTISNNDIEIDGKNVEYSHLYDDIFDVKAFNKIIGIEFDTFLGNNILDTKEVLIDSGNRMIVFGDNLEQQRGAYGYEMRRILGVPQIQINVNGNVVKTVFDTGAHISYLSDELLNGAKFLGEEDDFYPEYGDFKVKTFETEISIGDKKIPFKFGELPINLSLLFSSFNSECILGNDILSSFSALISNKNRMVTFMENGRIYE